jgi:NADH:ubiquinone oxidoreductase subunit K
MENQAIELLAGLLVMLVAIAVLVVIFRWLWNTTMPEVFGISTLSFWQAVRVLLLAGILFGGHRAVEVPQHMTENSATQALQGH